jgi:protein required for attachment to host cells
MRRATRIRKMSRARIRRHRPTCSGANVFRMERTWILVANAAGAKVYDAGRAQLSLLREIEHPEGRLRDAELVSDRSGRTRKAIGGMAPRTAVDPQTTPRAAEARRFALHLGKELDRARAAGEVEALVIVAPPHFLGLVQELLPRQVKRRLRASLARDYVALDPGRLRTELEQIGAL